jgi:hypothetical protein
MFVQILILLSFSFAKPEKPITANNKQSYCTISDYAKANNITEQLIQDRIKIVAEGLSHDSGAFLDFVKKIEFIPDANNQIYINVTNKGSASCSSSASKDEDFDCQFCQWAEKKDPSTKNIVIKKSFSVESMKTYFNYPDSLFFETSNGLTAACKKTSRNRISDMKSPFHSALVTLINSPKMTIKIPCDAIKKVVGSINEVQNNQNNSLAPSSPVSL